MYTRWRFIRISTQLKKIPETWFTFKTLQSCFQFDKIFCSTEKIQHQYTKRSHLAVNCKIKLWFLYYRRPTRMLHLQLRSRHWIQSLRCRWSHWNWKNQQTMGRIFQRSIYWLWHFWHQFSQGFGCDQKGPFIRCHIPHWLQLFWKVHRRETTEAKQNHWTMVNHFGFVHLYVFLHLIFLKVN
mgnify:CR=1 FL=1